MCGVACSLILINDAASSFIRIHVQRLGAWYTALNHKEENQRGKLKLHSCFSTVWPELLIFEVLDNVDFIDRGDEDVNGNET